MRPVVAVAMLLAVGAACGESQPPNLGDSDTSTTVTIVKTGTCSVEGQRVPCQVVTGVSNGVTNCFHGFQTCINGQWGVCGATYDASATDADTTDASAADADTTDTSTDADTSDASTDAATE